MGFQGTDPATDFRGMGLLGLYNLIYIAENHPVIFRRIVKEQSSREDNDYPVAVTGISITQLLFTLFKIGEDKQEPVVYNILFDHDFAFEEMYCIIFQLLDRTWDEMNAAYMDFPRVLNAGK
jgi:ELMO domain-containing protein